MFYDYLQKYIYITLHTRVKRDVDLNLDLRLCCVVVLKFSYIGGMP